LIKILSLGLLATIVCLALQAVALAVHYFAHIAKRPARPARVIFLEFSILMLTLMLGNIVQAAFWALIYILPVFSDVDGVMEVCRIGRST
jgi:hypothetical protein